jgi:hypothetical protein
LPLGRLRLATGAADAAKAMNAYKQINTLARQAFEGRL